MTTVSPGSKLGAYEIIGAIGAGGMGTVYRARDTRLPREVAIKVLAQKFSDRFSREAHAIAKLNHPNITTLYDIGPDYLVMELVDGMTLAERIRQGPLSLAEAAQVARQIADALDYAHERGIVHRDLKPGNINIRRDGVVKVLDFGLAKSGMPGALNSEEATMMTADKTEAGVIVGTLAYMAPEQLTGKDVGKRADIWAFGCVFYEMLTGEPLHRGSSPQEIMASILRDEPDLTKAPAPARRLLERCLEKDPHQRLRHIGDVMALMDERPAAKATKWRWPAAIALAITIAAAGFVRWAPWRQTGGGGVQPVRFEVGETEKMKFFYGAFMTVSPDGRWMVFPATGEDGVNRYWLRSLETVEARPLPGTETAYVPASWSADSRYVIFNLLNSNKLYKVDIQGGPPEAIAEQSDSLNGLTSNRGGVIVFATFSPNPLLRLGPGGGTTAVTALAKGETNHRWPQFLPDGRHFLYLRVSADPNRMGVYVGSMDAKPEEQSLTRLLATDRQAYYAAAVAGGPGHLIFLRDATLMAQEFDPVRLELSGEPTPIAEGVESFPIATGGLFSVSENGTLVYRLGPGRSVTPTWFDQRGKTAGTLAEPDDYANAAVSPEGSRIAVARGAAGSRDIWIIDVEHGTKTRLTFDPADDDSPVWSPDGMSIAFSSTRAGQLKIYVKPVDGSEEERVLSDEPGIPSSWSKDSRFLLFTRSSSRGNDIWALSDPGRAAGESKLFPLFESPSNEFDGQISPDGRWVAYTSNEGAGGDLVYVRPFPADGKIDAAGARWLMSGAEFAGFPRWRSDSRQLFFITVSGFRVMATDIDASKGFRAGSPRQLIEAPQPLIPVGWSLTPDAQRFLFITTPNGGRPHPFTVVLNWAGALKK